MAEAVLEVVIRARNELQATMAQIRGQVESISKAIGQSNSNPLVIPGIEKAKADLLTVANNAKTSVNAMGDLANTVLTLGKAFVGLEIIRFGQSLATTAAQDQLLTASLHAVAENAGIARSQVDVIAKSVRDLGLSSEATSSIMTRFIRAGLPIDQFKQLAEGARELSIAAGQPVQDVLARLIFSIQTLTTRSLRTLGVTVDLQTEIRKYAEANNLSRAAIDRHTQSLIFLNAIQVKLGQQAILSTDSQALLGRQLNQLNVQVSEARTAIGQNLIPVYQVVVEEGLKFFKNLQLIGDEMAVDGEGAKQLAENLRPLIAVVLAAGEFVVKHIEGIGAVILAYGAFRLVLGSVVNTMRDLRDLTVAIAGLNIFKGVAAGTAAGDAVATATGAGLASNAASGSAAAEAAKAQAAVATGASAEAAAAATSAVASEKIAQSAATGAAAVGAEAETAAVGAAAAGGQAAASMEVAAASVAASTAEMAATPTLLAKLAVFATNPIVIGIAIIATGLFVFKEIFDDIRNLQDEAAKADKALNTDSNQILDRVRELQHEQLLGLLIPGLGLLFVDATKKLDALKDKIKEINSLDLTPQGLRSTLLALESSVNNRIAAEKKVADIQNGTIKASQAEAEQELATAQEAEAKARTKLDLEKQFAGSAIEELRVERERELAYNKQATALREQHDQIVQLVTALHAGSTEARAGLNISDAFAQQVSSFETLLDKFKAGVTDVNGDLEVTIGQVALVTQHLLAAANTPEELARAWQAVSQTVGLTDVAIKQMRDQLDTKFIEVAFKAANDQAKSFIEGLKTVTDLQRTLIDESESDTKSVHSVTQALLGIGASVSDAKAGVISYTTALRASTASAKALVADQIAGWRDESKAIEDRYRLAVQNADALAAKLRSEVIVSATTTQAQVDDEKLANAEKLTSTREYYDAVKQLRDSTDTKLTSNKSGVTELANQYSEDLLLAEKYKEQLIKNKEEADAKVADQSKIVDSVKKSLGIQVGDYATAFEQIKNLQGTADGDRLKMEEDYLLKLQESQDAASKKLLTNKNGSTTTADIDNLKKNFDAAVAAASKDQQELETKLAKYSDLTKKAQADMATGEVRSVSTRLDAEKNYYNSVNKLSLASADLKNLGEITATTKKDYADRLAVAQAYFDRVKGEEDALAAKQKFQVAVAVEDTKKEFDAKLAASQSALESSIILDQREAALRTAANLTAIQQAATQEAGARRTLAAKEIDDLHASLDKQLGLYKTMEDQKKKVISDLTVQVATNAKEVAIERQNVQLLIAADKERLTSYRKTLDERLKAYQDTANKIKGFDDEIFTNEQTRQDKLTELRQAGMTDEQKQNDNLQLENDAFSKAKEARDKGDFERAKQYNDQALAFYDKTKSTVTGSLLTQAQSEKDINNIIDQRNSIADAQKKQAIDAAKLQLAAIHETEQNIQFVEEQLSELGKKQVLLFKVSLDLSDTKEQLKAAQDQFKEFKMPIFLDAPDSALAGLRSKIENALKDITVTLNASVKQGLATGGMIYGPGTPTSDSIPIMASAGEYVVRAASVEHYGPGFMDMINRMALPNTQGWFLNDTPVAPQRAFASGGLVEGGAAATASRDSVDVNLNVGGQRISLMGERAQVRRLVSTLKNLEGV